MKKLLIAGLLCIVSAFPTLRAASSSTHAQNARALAQRLAPALADKIVFELTTPTAEGHDRFIIEQQGAKVAVRGNNVTAMTAGLGHYLKYYCRSSVSWFVDDPVELPAVLPDVPAKVERESRADTRFFLNYCTFGYTMPWWQWRDWERLIDWMALQGINMPLAITGQESVWDRVWQRMGIPRDEVRAYFTGPAHLPWHRMINVDRFQGNLPDSWLEHQERLQKQIVDRERSLGMRPVLPAFSGHVPEALGKVYPEAKISRMTKWGGFDDKYRSFFLDPMDPLFPKIQRAFIEEQTRLYGTDHIYGIDPFNEVEPPSWDPEFLARAGKYISSTVTDVDPQAVWLQMTWMLYHQRKLWTDERVRAYITAIPSEHNLLLDYFCDRTEVWRRTESYYGAPYIWCYLGNFGGNTNMVGDIATTGRRIEDALANGGKNLCGIGSTLEGLDANPLMYEYVFEKAWSGMPSDSAWVEAWADRRAGRADSLLHESWQMLRRDVYSHGVGVGMGSATNSRPQLKGNSRYVNPNVKYDNRLLTAAWLKMLAAADSSATIRDSYLFDIVNTGRQVLGNHFLHLRVAFAEAYERRDLAELQRQGALMLELLDDSERLLQGHGTFLLGKWLEQAAAFGGDNEDERRYYTTNARTILTTWGERRQQLNDYANRSWAGLTAGYYAPRWKMFVDDVCKAVAEGREFDQEQFTERVCDFELAFAYDGPGASAYRSSPAAPAESLALARQLARKWSRDIFKSELPDGEIPEGYDDV